MSTKETSCSRAGFLIPRNDRNKKTTISLLQRTTFRVDYWSDRMRENETLYHIDILDIVVFTVFFPLPVVKIFLKIVHLLYS